MSSSHVLHSIGECVQALLDTQRRAVEKYGAQPLNLWVGKSTITLVIDTIQDSSDQK